MALKTKRRSVGAPQALQRLIKQGHMGCLEAVRQIVTRHSKAVILAGDHHAICPQIFHRVVRTVMAMGHFFCLGATCQRQYLVAKANAKNRQILFQQLSDRGDRIVTGFWISGTVGKEHAIWLQSQHLGSRRLGRHHREPNTTISQQAQNVVLHTKVVGHYMKVVGFWLAVAVDDVPGALGPAHRFCTRNHLCQIHPRQTRELKRFCKCHSVVELSIS